MFLPPPFHPRRPHLVAPVKVDRDGRRGPTSGQVRRHEWRRVAHGHYVPTEVPQGTQQRIVQAAVGLRPNEAVTGWAALHWRGGRWFTGVSSLETPEDVPVTVSRHLMPRPGVVRHQSALSPNLIEWIDGLPVTCPELAVAYVVCRAPSPAHAVAALDMACYSDLVSIAEMESLLPMLGPTTGIQQLRGALAAADENSWSPRESHMRWV